MFDRSILVRLWITCIIISNSNIWIPFMLKFSIHESKYLNFLSRPSLSHAPSCSYHSLFSSSPARSLHVSPIFANMVSRRLPWEVSHSPYHYKLHVFHYLSRLYHSLVSLGTQAFFFTATHTLSLVFHFVFLSIGFSHTPYISLDMTHTTKITLSRRHNICCGLLSVSIPVIKLTLFICLPIRQTPPSLSHTHTQLLLPLPFPTTVSLTHTQNSRFRTPDSYFSHKHWSTSLQIGLYTRTLVLPLSRTCLSRAPCIYVDFSSLLETCPLDHAHTHYRLILS